MSWIKDRFLRPEVSRPLRLSLAAAEPIPKGSVCVFNGQTKKVSVAGPLSNATLVAVHTEDIEADDVAAGTLFAFAHGGEVEVLADLPVVEGDLVAVGLDGCVATSGAFFDVPILSDESGVAFTNQPANDGVEVVSSSALDTQVLRIWGTTNGGNVITHEDLTLTGTSAASTVKTDWGVILGVEIQSGGSANGTITVREASGNAAITTITATNLRSGVKLLTGNNARAYQGFISGVASGSSTKVLGLVGTATDGTALEEATALSGTTSVKFSNRFRSITKVLVGDVESSRTVTVTSEKRPGTISSVIGFAKEDIAAGELGTIAFTPLHNIYGLATSILDTVVDKQTVQLSPTEVQSLNSTPKLLVRSPGPGKAIVFLGALVKYDYAGTAFGGIASGEDLAIKYTDGSGAQVAEVETTGFLDQTTSQQRYAYPAGNAGAALASVAIVSDAPLVASLLVGGITGGTNGSVSIDVYYKIISV